MHVGSTKRKAAVRCAAANDDEDLGGLVDLKEPHSRGDRAAHGGSASSRDGAKGDEGPKPKKKKAKEFAWMDSEDEDESDGADHDEDRREEKDAPSENEEEVSVDILDKVQNFGRMMLIAPSVRGKLRGGSLEPPEVAATCRALGRVKFFDRELLDDLYVALQKLLAEGRLGPVETGDAVACMAVLNAYDAATFSAISRSWMLRTGELDAQSRNEWGEAFKLFGHKSEPAFLQLLEVPPAPILHPSYKKVRCWHFSRGSCILGEACTYSHDPRAPLSLADGTKEDWWKKGSLMMTQNQKNMGNGSYGTGPLGMNP
mmetsp:Transcript_102224/g.286569  ORF Transcript_102224/g.286569 Transcript_102224/m.286569 type:complete len:315 (+) Transcript_102224:92-1036(+)|eukprot:CAMPEP_0176236750 /NCGR_PEP_ID=MMETSP0121_2-20121125/27499_1 /TAXON_ID=160619 /ORGANISM="Kryptoperidinium foliaceum, Strain CCMP 1326" /LENGTH=314 /DNA_ID=CAMNT_0017576181 /DNA_START=97 /DNA_END=1041 /DNA_ORIENTATION=-